MEEKKSLLTIQDIKFSIVFIFSISFFLGFFFSFARAYDFNGLTINNGGTQGYSNQNFFYSNITYNAYSLGSSYSYSYYSSGNSSSSTPPGYVYGFNYPFYYNGRNYVYFVKNFNINTHLGLYFKDNYIALGGQCPTHQNDFFQCSNSYFSFGINNPDDVFLHFDIEKLSTTVSNIKIAILKDGSLDVESSTSFDYKFLGGHSYNFRIYFTMNKIYSTINYTEFFRISISNAFSPSNNINVFKGPSALYFDWKLDDIMNFDYSARFEVDVIDSNNHTNTVVFNDVFEAGTTSTAEDLFKFLGDNTSDSYYISRIFFTYTALNSDLTGYYLSEFEYYIKGHKYSIDSLGDNISFSNGVTVFAPSGTGKPFEKIEGLTFGDFNSSMQGSKILLLKPILSTVGVLTDNNITVYLERFNQFKGSNTNDFIEFEYDYLDKNLSYIVGSLSSVYDYIFYPSFQVDNPIQGYGTHSARNYLFISDRVYLLNINDNLKGGFSSVMSALPTIIDNQAYTYQLFKNEFNDINKFFYSIDNKLTDLGAINNNTYNSLDKLDTIIDTLLNLDFSSGGEVVVDNEIDTPQELGYNIIDINNITIPFFYKAGANNDIIDYFGNSFNFLGNISGLDLLPSINDLFSFFVGDLNG